MGQEQKEDLVKIVEETLRKLESITERGWAAYPVSLLLYPKEKIKEALENYLATHDGKPPSVESEKIKFQYLSLSRFIDDEDAVLMNSVALKNGANFEQRDKMKTIELPNKLEGTEYPKRMTEIMSKINAEDAELRARIFKF